MFLSVGTNSGCGADRRRTGSEPCLPIPHPPISCYNRTLNTYNYNMERGAYQSNASICRCFPEWPCARGRYYLCERSVFDAVFAREVGNPLRPRSVIPCTKGRYPLRERSAFLVRKVCIFEALTADSCVSVGILSLLHPRSGLAATVLRFRSRRFLHDENLAPEVGI